MPPAHDGTDGTSEYLIPKAKRTHQSIPKVENENQKRLHQRTAIEHAF
ncbi:hypothetical protein HMPREF1860_01203 [Prevotella amnii]|uniref:Uncharacterized protein n=1 Tax=Prevotella amnii TaxID=419005 RepID=A0A134BE50_9BACT|nr:hypothetical protein HMPREF1860_01203 [Prevotella amnii]